MKAEYAALVHNQTWTLVPPISQTNILSCRWVFRTKTHVDGSFERRKARLVAKGYHQQFGVDYLDTFSPVVKASTIRLIISLAISHADPSLFILNYNATKIYLLVYVDDIVITTSQSSAISNLIHDLGIIFPVKDLGPLSFFLGIEVDYTPSGLVLSQRKYINSLLARTQMLTTNPMSSPMAASLKLSKHDTPDFDDATIYRSIVGGLQYLSMTRPDMSFSVNKVCQFMHSPKVPHWSAIKCILRYLKATINHGLFFSSNSSLTLQVYSDADWEGCPDDRRSTSGTCIFLGKHLISWSSKKQQTVARSSTEVEYKAIASSAAEVTWLQTVLRELAVPLSQAPTLWCDNLGATYLSANPVYHSKTKHMDIDYHFVRDKVAAHTLKVSFISSKDQIADILTKPLVADKFSHLRTSLKVVDTPLDSRGRIKIHNSESPKSIPKQRDKHTKCINC
ncbi:uncharacterized mitochondrial protein AtMg00810-like [Carya illinoinensis]|uniref:uncharacterized mitochondrial protein AtMg00810-like n=1 Tax=Carya illinoinensis TaxID=32201 RepID=UPI001C726F5C|nr:uncharacterized mitochondrial protein AtMg00810-like [Carya illinoinensis]